MFIFFIMFLVKKVSNNHVSASSLKNISTHSNFLTVDSLSLGTFFFKRSFSFEQQLVNVVNSNNIANLNLETYNLIFKNNSVKTGIAMNLIDQTIQKLPNHMYSFRKALNPTSFFNDYPKLNIVVPPTEFSSVQNINQRTSHVYEVTVARALELEFKEKVCLTHGHILNPKLAFKQTGQKSCDFFCAKVSSTGGSIYTYYCDLKVTDKDAFINKVSYLHPSKLILCQVYVVGKLTDSFMFDSATKNKLLTGCQHYMSQHIIENTPIAQYQNQFNKELHQFDLNPTVQNYNSLVVAPWRIFTAPSLSKIFNI